MEITSGDARATIDDTTLKALREVGSDKGRGMWLGLAGGIGAGKSTVSAIWQQMGAHLADADKIAREIVEPGMPALKEIADRFGEHIVPGGVLDRAGLAKIVFSDEEALADLNRITHGRIWDRALEILETATPGELAVYDAAILIGSRSEKLMDAVAVVVADEEVRVDRLVNVRNMDEVDARARIAGQMSSDEMASKAHIVIENNGSVEDVQEVAREIYRALLVSDRIC
ncbi:MAG: dephospho-CoA kinase [Actinomycetaceae bacterium]|nr:dephospho-CoA kinase [Actinomycetaceae bacterium]